MLVSRMKSLNDFFETNSAAPPIAHPTGHQFEDPSEEIFLTLVRIALVFLVTYILLELITQYYTNVL